MERTPEKIRLPNGQVILWYDESNPTPANCTTNKNGLRILKDGNWPYLKNGKIVMVHPYPHNHCKIDNGYYDNLLTESDNNRKNTN